MRLPFIVVGFFFFGSCTNSDLRIRELAIEEARIMERSFVQRKNDECTKLWLEEAERLADSIVASKTFDPIGDSSYIPELREKPLFVEVDSLVFKKAEKILPLDSIR